jgi:hypothetical protein
MKKLFATLCIALSTSGCITLGNYDNDGTLESETESYFLIGVNSTAYKLTFFRGEVKNGRFDQNILYPATLSATPKNGFIMGKAPEGTTHALIHFDNSDKSIFSRMGPYRPCGEGKTMVFTVAGGKVLYLGDIAFKDKSTLSFKPVSISNINAAKKYLSKYHPQLKDKIVTWEYQLIPTTKSCSTVL